MGNKKLAYLVAAIITLSLPLTLILIKQNQDNRSSAASPDQLEAEGGVLSSSGASKQADSQASGGQYVVLANQTTPTPTPVTFGANSYFVATNGNDSNNGSQTTPWKTLQKSSDSVPAGGVVYIRNGEYNNFIISRSGTSTSPITFTSYPGETAVVTGKNMPRDAEGFGTTNDHVIKISGAKYIILRGLTVEAGRGVKYAHQGGGILVANNADNIQIRNNIIRDNIAFGIRTYNATNVTIDGNDIKENAAGIAIEQNSAGVVISNNQVHNQNKMITNTVGGNDDTGAQGISFIKSFGKVVARNNKLWNNIAPSYDYVYDGGAFEIFGASDVEMTDNIMWDNDVILETGTKFADTNEDVKGCNRNIFARNLAYNTKPTSTNRADAMMGLILRCARDNIVANNTILYPTYWTFDVNRNSTDFSGYIDRLKILNNVVVMDEGKILAMTNCSGCASVVFDYNLLYNPGNNLAQAPQGITSSLTTLRSWGYNLNGINASPVFVDSSSNNYQLAPNSPGIGTGIPISGITSGSSVNMGFK